LTLQSRDNQPKSSVTLIPPAKSQDNTSTIVSPSMIYHIHRITDGLTIKMNTTTHQFSPYLSLDCSLKEIGLLVIHAESKTGEIYCSLTYTGLIAELYTEYGVFSYCWLDTKDQIVGSKSMVH